VFLFLQFEGTLENLTFSNLLHGVYGSAWVWFAKAGVHFVPPWGNDTEGMKFRPWSSRLPSDGLWG